MSARALLLMIARAAGLTATVVAALVLGGSFGRAFRLHADAPPAPADPDHEAADAAHVGPGAAPVPDPLDMLLTGRPGRPGYGRSLVAPAPNGAASEGVDDLAFPPGCRPLPAPVPSDGLMRSAAGESRLSAADAAARTADLMVDLGWTAVPAPPDRRPGVLTMGFARPGARCWTRVEPLPEGKGCRIVHLRMRTPTAPSEFRLPAGSGANSGSRKRASEFRLAEASE